MSDVSMSASSGMAIEATTSPPSLVDHLVEVAGQDPILMGATGYLDTVFTSRLMGDSE